MLAKTFEISENNASQKSVSQMTTTQAPYFREQGFDLILTKTEYSELDRKILTESLNLLKGLLRSTEGRSLGEDEVVEINRKLRSEGKEQIIAKGGQSALFVMNLEMPSLPYPKIVIKPYSLEKLSVASLVTHYVAVLEFKKLFQQLPMAGFLRNKRETDILVRCMGVLGFGMLQEEGFPPFTIFLQEKSEGITFDKAGQNVPLNMSSIAKNIAKHGFIIDPFERNWRIAVDQLDSDVLTKLEYIDIILLNATDTQRQLIRKLLDLFQNS